MLKRKHMVLAGMALMAVTSFAQPKYIFYFIGDGMGAAQRQIAEEYKGSLSNSVGGKNK